jgi:hypothetical protein
MPSAHEVLESLSGGGIPAVVDAQVALRRYGDAAMTEALAYDLDWRACFLPRSARLKRSRAPVIPLLPKLYSRRAP